MAVIDSKQGMIKQSEVAADRSQPLLDTVQNEDCLTVIEQLRRIASDSLRRIGLLLTSKVGTTDAPGSIIWTGAAIQFNGTDIVVKLLQNENGGVIDLILRYGTGLDPDKFDHISLGNGEIFYIELDRAKINSGPVYIHNGTKGGAESGKVAKVASSLPELKSIQGDGVHGTICIPLAVRVGTMLWWQPHGILWPGGTTSPLGAVITTTTIPNGIIQQYHKFPITEEIPPGSGNYVISERLDPLGHAGMIEHASGFQLCNGSIVIAGDSPYRNPTRNADGTPKPSTNFGLDIFTPNLNGPMFTYSSDRPYAPGDYVLSPTDGLIYVAIQEQVSGSGQIAPGNLAYWRPPTGGSGVGDWGYNVENVGNPYSKYRRTTTNDIPPVSGGTTNTFLRGSSQNRLGNLAIGYGGANRHLLTQDEMPSHTHGVAGHPGKTGVQDTSHSHSGNVGTTGSSHQHPVSDDGSPGDGSYPKTVLERRGRDAYKWTWGNHTRPGYGMHTHNVTIGNQLSSHRHIIGNTGLSVQHNNEPRYFNVINIIKIF